MEILRARIDWNLECMNDPRLEILVDKIPEREDLVYDKVGTCYLASEEGYVSFLAWSGKKNDGGFGGREWDIRVRKGKEIKIVCVKGPWSSRPGVMNKFFPHSVDAAITDSFADFERGYTFMAGHITLEKAKEAIAKVGSNITLLKMEYSDGEIEYIPARFYARPKPINISIA